MSRPQNLLTLLIVTGAGIGSGMHCVLTNISTTTLNFASHIYIQSGIQRAGKQEPIRRAVRFRESRYYSRQLLMHKRTKFAAQHTPGSSDTDTLGQPQEGAVAGQVVNSTAPNPQAEAPAKQSIWSMLKPSDAKIVDKPTSLSDAKGKP